MSEVALVSAIIEAYDLAGLDLPTAHEGFTFTPPDAAPWAEVIVLPVSSDQRLQSVDKNRSLVQIDLHFPRSKGWLAIRQATDTLVAHFAPDRRFESRQAFTVRTREPTRIRPEGAWLRRSISVVIDVVMDRAAAG